MTRSNFGEGSRPATAWITENPLYDNRRQVGVVLLSLAAVFNLLDLITTSFALANGFAETYAPSLMIMGAMGFPGYVLVKLAVSALLIRNAQLVWSKSDKIGAKAGLVVLLLCLAMLVENVVPVANNFAVLTQYLG